MAPRSSIMANAIKNIFKLVGTLFPNKEAIPKEKAISVAVGIPHPAFKTRIDIKYKNR